MGTLTQQQQQSLDGNHEVQEEQDHVNGAAVSAQSHAVDRFRGEAGRSARETAVVAPSNDSVGDSSTLCSDDDDVDDDDEEEETNIENSGGWVTNPSVSSTVVQQHQGFDNTNGFVVLPNSDPSRFGDISVANSTKVRVGNDTRIINNGPVTFHVNHVVYTNPTPNPKDESRLDVSRASDNISDLSEISESEVNGAPNGSIFSQNTKLNKVMQWLWRWKRATLSCVLALILLAIVVSVTVYFTYLSDASVFLEMTNSSLEAILCQALATASTRAACRYYDEWISCKYPVPPKTRATLTCKDRYRPESNLLSGQRRNVRCNANGQWEPEPMRCVPKCGTLPVDYKPTFVGSFRPIITEFPWHASMYRDEPGEPKRYFCGASIIQENLLITAAQCVYDENIKQPIDASKIYIVTGNSFRDYNSRFHDSNLVKKNQVKRIYIVRNYLGIIGNYLWDIAVLELVTPFVLSSYLVPACIDTLSDKSVLEPGSYGTIAGFGRTAFGESGAILQALIVPIISLSQCRSASQNVNTEQFITNDKFCAGYTNGSSVCDGDGGGGLVLKTNNLWYLRGVASVPFGTIHYGSGVSHCDYNLYSLYTEISRHISWIQEVITKIEQNQTRILCSEESQTRCS